MAQKTKAPGSDAGGENITEKISAKPEIVSRGKTVPAHIIARQREKMRKLKAAKGPGMKKLLMDLVPEILAEDYVPAAILLLQRYKLRAKELHHLHHDDSHWRQCPNPICVENCMIVEKTEMAFYREVMDD